MAGTKARMEDVLMLVKTYPTPSATYGELVCTAGIRLSDGAWVRIYPYPFRLLNEDKRFNKGNVLRLPIVKAANDRRPESYKIANIYDIKVLDFFDTRDNWKRRMDYIEPTALMSVEALKVGMFPDSDVEDERWGSSISPIRVQSNSARLRWEKTNGWSESQLVKLRKAEDFVKDNLFLDDEIKASFRTLARVPYEFRLRYLDIGGAEYEHLILDWEIPQLYFNVRRNETSDEAALEKVRLKIEESIFALENDVYLIIGNIHHRFRNPDAIAITSFAI
jgi:hypothetical protein